MLDRLELFETGRLDLGKLVADLRGLFIEADPHDPETRSEFEEVWAPLDAEHELRTEDWAPRGLGSDESLARSLGEFRQWVIFVLSNSAEDHA